MAKCDEWYHLLTIEQLKKASSLERGIFHCQEKWFKDIIHADKFKEDNEALPLAVLMELLYTCHLDASKAQLCFLGNRVHVTPQLQGMDFPEE